MSLELSIRTAEAGTDTFVPADHLLGIVQHCVASLRDTRIVLRGKDELVIFPERGIYYASIQDMAEFCRAPAAQFESESVDKTTLPYISGTGKSINHLLWQAAFHVSQGRLIEGCSKYDVVQLRHWPNLPRLPVTPNAARICALLTRHPTTVMLIHRVLGIDKEEVYQIYSSAYSAGLGQLISRNPAQHAFEESADDTPFEPVADRGIFRSLFAKISRL
jgi:hypothetical protein